MISCAVPPDPTVEQAAIRQQIERWNEAIADSDVETIMSLYTDASYLMPPNAPQAAGPDAIGEVWTALLGAPGFGLVINTEVIEVAGASDMAYEVGSYSLGMDGPDGRIEDVGKYVVVWVKTDGEWLVAADIFNSDLPVM